MLARNQARRGAFNPAWPHCAAGPEASPMRSILLYFLGVPVVVIILLNVFNVL